MKMDINFNSKRNKFHKIEMIARSNPIQGEKVLKYGGALITSELFNITENIQVTRNNL
jgi:hypothetical protein